MGALNARGSGQVKVERSLRLTDGEPRTIGLGLRKLDSKFSPIARAEAQ